MEFGKVSSILGLDLGLPADPPENENHLCGLDQPGARLRIGLTGWREKAWLGGLYPKGLEPASFLDSYSASFHTIELNSTFYAMPVQQVVDRWLKQTPSDFRFMVKIPRTLSHSSGFASIGDEINRFLLQLEHFGEKASACFLQLPSTFRPADTHLLQPWADYWPKHGLRLFVEYRDPAIFEDEQLMKHMAASRFGLVITDTPGRRDLFHMRLSLPEVMIRFVAAGDEQTDLRRLDDWTGRLESWFNRGLNQAWFFCHTHDNRGAPELARLFRTLVQRANPTWSASIPEINNYASKQTNLFQTPA